VKIQRMRPAREEERAVESTASPEKTAKSTKAAASDS